MAENIFENTTEVELGEEYLDGVEDMFGDIKQQVYDMMKENPGNQVPQNIWDMWAAFRSAVDWSEGWIQGLLAFHVMLLMLVIVFRNNENVQTGLFVCICTALYFSERLNTYGAEHWREFSTQDYFDERGVFASVMYAGPLLCIGLIQLVNLLRVSSSLLIKSKRMQLQAQYKKNKTTTVPDSSGGGGGGGGGKKND